MKACKQCGESFTPRNNYQKYCTVRCKRRVYQMPGGVESTEAQYRLINGDWSKYFSRLCTRAFRREALTRDDCLRLLKHQDGRCALTGVELTYNLTKGTVCRTNASIDRIDPKGPYTPDNVQLVCVAVNKLRVDMSVEEFITWCKRVSDHAIRK